MKKITLFFISSILLTMFFGQRLNAQSNKEEIELYQSVFGMEKKAVVADFLKLENTSPFWAIYDEYETARKALGKDRLNALEDYVANYDKMDDLKYDEVIKSMISLRKDTDKLIDTYYKKVKKACGSKTAAQFFQLEAYFLSVIRLKIMDGIPYIGEFDK
jgi:hypothetical protein